MEARVNIPFRRGAAILALAALAGGRPELRGDRGPRDDGLAALKAAEPRVRAILRTTSGGTRSGVSIESPTYNAIICQAPHKHRLASLSPGKASPTTGSEAVPLAPLRRHKRP